MAFRYFIGFLLSCILVGCAQVGQITGGEKDTVAPQLIDSKTTPPNNSIYFSGNSFSSVLINCSSSFKIFLPS